MAILIVDDESNTRNALRDLLAQLGHKTILEAKNGEEALKTAEAEKSRIRLIIADWEMPYMDGVALLERIALLPELDRAPFLLITSDLPRARLTELKANTSRLDAFLIKPFRMTALADAMSAAQAHRASLRRKIIAWSARGALPASLQAAFAQPSVADRWDAPSVTRTLPEFQAAIQAQLRQLGAILIDPALSAPELPDLAAWLAAFGRTPLGTLIPVVCAHRDPEVISPLRTLCQIFMPPEADWKNVWAGLRGKAESALEIELLFQELKSALQRKMAPAARQTCEKILALDDTNPEAHATLGDLLDAQSLRAQAITHYRSALRTNPCQPKPYIRLLECLAPGSPALALAADEATAYCPQNPDVLFAAARAWLANGDAQRAQDLARRILALQPQHAGARTLAVPAS